MGDVHELFKATRWIGVESRDYQHLEQSMLLATKLIQVGMPYIANFLAFDVFLPHGELDKDGVELLCPHRIRLKTNVAAGKIADAKAKLDALAKTVIRWQLNSIIWRKLGWIGITRLVDNDENEWDLVPPEDIRAADVESKDLGKKSRPLIIGIMAEYVKTIKESPEDSEQHIRAVFMAAVTMAHEIGHAILHSDFRSYNPPNLQEPYVEKDRSAELGASFISWIFGGWHPQSAGQLPEFRSQLYWQPQYTQDDKERPLYSTLHAIPIPYIQNLLSPQFWLDVQGHPDLNSTDLAIHNDYGTMWLNDSAAVRHRLRPVLTSSIATATLPEWTISNSTGDPEWKANNSVDWKGYNPGNEVNGLTQADIDYEAARTGVKPNLFSGEMQPNARDFMRRMKRRDIEEDPEEHNDKVELKPENRDDLDDGVLDADLRPPSKIDSTPLTRIVIHYLFGTGRAESKKHARRSDNDTDDDRRRKRVRIETAKTTLAKFLPVMIDDADAKAFIRSTSLYVISNLTRLEISDLCRRLRLNGFANFSQLESWQGASLNRASEDDMAVAHRIRESILLAGLNNTDFPHFGIDAQLSIEEESLQGVAGWAKTDLEGFCQDQGLELSHERSALILRVQQWKRAHMENTRSGDPTQPPDHLGAHMAEDFSDPTESMNLNELKNFCRLRELPQWGTRRALVAKVQRQQADDALVTSGVSNEEINVRVGQPYRTDKNGFEMYAFKAILGQSSVTALKSAIFLKGNFRPSTDFKLFFYPGEREEDVLENDQPLSSYKRRDWTTLRLKVYEKWRFGPIGKRDSPIDLTGPANPLGSRDRFPIPPTAKPDPRVERLVALANDEEPTLAETLAKIAARTPALERLVQTRPGDPSQASRKLTSGLEIFEEVEDYQEDEEEAVKSVKETLDLTRDEKKTPRQVLYESRRQPGSSHMADVLRGTPKPKSFEGKERNNNP